MAELLDAGAVAQQAIKLGLVTDAQVQEAWDELGQKGGEVLPFLLALERKGYLTPWQSQKLVKGDNEGFFLGGYRILYKIASGSFGRVFRADDPLTGTVVAIKVLRRRWSEDKHNIELFEREGKVGLGLDHPNLVKILAVSRDAASGQHYIVMEFVEGGNLRELLRIRGKLEPAEALRILEDAASGLAYAFSRGVTHRDMKLTNVLISSQGVAKLVDFGLAGIFHSVKQEDDSQVDRTVDYAGLEKATGTKQGDVRSDIYFLGCVFYEMLTGRPPLDMSKNKFTRMLKERFVNVKPVGRDEVKAPPSLFRLLDSMMALDPRQRYQTPSQLLDAIREVRKEVEGRADKNGAAAPVRSMFIVEANERLQDQLRTRFKELGFRVFLASDPVRAVDRFRQQPYDALIIDFGTTGEESLHFFERLMADADRQGIPLAGVALIDKEHADLAAKITKRPKVAALVQPVTFKQLHQKLRSLLSE